MSLLTHKNISNSKSDDQGNGDDFPILCETCLGSNPYLKMTKKPFGDKQCKVSKIAYQGFRWKPDTQGRYKETIICYAVAADRNICQCCLNDMKYGLPVGVRDALLTQPSNKIALPESVVGQQYYFQQKQQQGEVSSGFNNESIDSQASDAVADQQLRNFSKIKNSVNNATTTAFRNLPKLCSFWLNGRCERVKRSNCPFRPCCGSFAFPEIAQQRELHQQLVNQLTADGPANVQNKLSQEIKNAFKDSMKGNRDDSIRKRVIGEDSLSKKYLENMKQRENSLQPPEDQSIVTLFLGNIDEGLNEEHIKSVIYPYGVFRSVHLVRPSRCAFVEYVDRPTAEAAARQMVANSLTIYDRVINVNWSNKSPAAVSMSHAAPVAFVPASQPWHYSYPPNAYSNSNSSSSGSGGVMIMPPPPGMQYAPHSMYAVPGMVAPIVGHIRPREDVNSNSTAAATTDEDQPGGKKRLLSNGEAEFITSFSKSDTVKSKK